MRKRWGFTLVEVLTVIFIFGVLASITSYVYGSSLARSRDNQRLSDLNSIKNTLEQFYLENRYYPKNTAYKSGLDNHPWVAKYELEKYILSEEPNCNSTTDDPGKSFLAPHYITTIPEDPRYKLLPSLNSNCEIVSTASGNVPGYGQYVYASHVKSEDDKPKTYTLMARLERTTHISKTLFNIDPVKYTLASQKVNSWGYTFCSAEDIDPTATSCSYNYYLSTSNND